MLRSTMDLTGYSIHATDGGIGKVEDCFFDDEKWIVRYFVVHTGGWLTGRKILVSPIAIRAIDWEGRFVSVNLSRVQIENSPDIDLSQPISRALEAQYFQYYRWPYYWTGAGVWGAAGVPEVTSEFPFDSPFVSPLGAQATDALEEVPPLQEDQNIHLRSSQECLGYRIEALDAHFGHLSDFLFDDTGWKIRFLVIQTRNWIPGTPVLIAPDTVELLDWNHRRLHLNLTEMEIKNAQKYSA